MLFKDPEEHAANPPETWEARKVGRTWALYSKDGAEVWSTFRTKRDALEARTTGGVANLYRDEGRWFAGEQVHEWKPWEKVKAENEARCRWQADNAAKLREARAK